MRVQTSRFEPIDVLDLFSFFAFAVVERLRDCNIVAVIHVYLGAQ
jgi:hypothetical protein